MQAVSGKLRQRPREGQIPVAQMRTGCFPWQRMLAPSCVPAQSEQQQLMCCNADNFEAKQPQRRPYRDSSDHSKGKAAVVGPQTGSHSPQRKRTCAGGAASVIATSI